MNQFKKEDKKPKKGKKGNKKSLGQILVGALELELLSKKDIRKWLPFILFISGLAFYYISNRMQAEKRIRHLNQLETEIRDLEADYHDYKSKLANKTRRSKVTTKALEMGLVFPKNKPEVIQKSE